MNDSILKLLKDRYFLSTESSWDDLAKRVSEYEYKMELLRYEQAQQFKSICTPEQREKFEALVKEIRDYFKPNNQPPRKGDRPPRRDEKPIKRND